MKQIENKSYGANTPFHKMKIANKLMVPERKAIKRDKRKSRNAYRLAVGLPEIK